MIHECLYLYLVIEEYPEGVFALPKTEDWYEWVHPCWIACSKPEDYNNIVSFAL